LVSPICLYASLFLIIFSSLELIALILLERLRRTRICVVNPAMNLIMVRVQLGYLQRNDILTLGENVYTSKFAEL
jgi:hypothetical protein